MPEAYGTAMIEAEQKTGHEIDIGDQTSAISAASKTISFPNPQDSYFAESMDYSVS